MRNADASDGAALVPTKGAPEKSRPDNALERGVAQIDALEEAHEGLVERVENIRGAGADEVTL